jgi:hypothetical protein
VFDRFPREQIQCRMTRPEIVRAGRIINGQGTGRDDTVRAAGDRIRPTCLGGSPEIVSGLGDR